MNGGGAAAALVTGTFAVTGSYFLFRVVFGFSWIDRVNSLTHVAMAVTMVLMSAPVLEPLPIVVQLLVFAAATLWYVYLLAARGRVNPGPLFAHHASSLPLLWYHAFMMASMVWMALVMSPFVSSAGPVPAMSHGSGAAMGAGTGVTVSPAQATAIDTTLGVVFVVAAVWLVAVFVVSGRGMRGLYGIAARLDAAGSVFMASGMAIVFFTLET